MREASRQVNDSLYSRFKLRFFTPPLRLSTIEVVLTRNVSATRAKTIATETATRDTAGTINVGPNDIMRYSEQNQRLFIPSAFSLADISTAGADCATFASSKAAQTRIVIAYIVYKRDFSQPLSILPRWSLGADAARAKSFALQTMQGWFQLYTNGLYVTKEGMSFDE
jgi:hypothetical protein